MRRGALPLIRRGLHRANRFFAILSGFALLLMMFVGSVDVIGSSLFNHPLPGAFEGTEALMVTSVFLALGLSQQRRAHISVEVIVGLMPRLLRRLAWVLSALLCALFFSLMAWFGWGIAIKSFSAGEFSSGLINFPIWPAKGALAFGVSLMALQCVWDLLVSLGIADEEPGDLAGGPD